MRQIHTAPMEIFASLHNGSFTLEPYEAGWASEAIAMIYIREFYGPAPSLRVQAQISVDGVRWIDHHAARDDINAAQGYALLVEHFGNWLRLAGEVMGGPEDGSPAFIADLYWVLKE